MVYVPTESNRSDTLVVPFQIDPAKLNPRLPDVTLTPVIGVTVQYFLKAWLQPAFGLVLEMETPVRVRT